MRKYILAVLLSIVLVATPALAGTYVCTGTVTNLSVYAAGYISLNLSVQGMPFISVCSLTANFGNWTPDQCKAIYSTLLSAKLQGLPVSIGFSDNLSCTSQPPNGNPNSSYTVYIPN